MNNNIKAILPYIGVNILYENTEIPFLGINGDEIFVDEEGSSITIDKVKLILKPLSSISDEDVISCGRIAKLKGEIKIERFNMGLKMIDDNDRSVILYFNNTSNIRVYDTIKQVEVIEYTYPIYLHCTHLGYDLETPLLNNKTLFQSGLAIYK